MFDIEFTPTDLPGIQKERRNEVKISVEGLSRGMYVTRLERSWIENTFPPKGFRIDSDQQIETIKRSTRLVYVDTLKGVTPDHRFWILEKDQLRLTASDEPPIFNTKKTDEYTKLKKYFYEITSDLELELETAKEVKERIAKNTKRILHDLQTGKTLDIDTVKQGVVAIVDSIIRNPSAFSLISQLKGTDSYSYSHAISTSVWCAQFGRHLGLGRDDINSLALGGMLLDVGKVKIPVDILNKTTGFSDKDLMIIRSHVDFSLRAAVKAGGVSPKVLQMIATHHERANGSGYPEGIKNEQIPIFGRIAGIVDSFDAMTSVRPYSPEALTPHDAINILYHSSGDLFQRELIEQFIQTVGVYPTGSLVEFKTGEVGVVVAVHDMKRLYPTVMLLLDKNKRPLEEFITIDLSSEKESGLEIVHGLPHGAFGIKMEELFL